MIEDIDIPRKSSTLIIVEILIYLHSFTQPYNMFTEIVLPIFSFSVSAFLAFLAAKDDIKLVRKKLQINRRGYLLVGLTIVSGVIGVLGYIYGRSPAKLIFKETPNFSYFSNGSTATLDIPLYNDGDYGSEEGKMLIKMYSFKKDENNKLTALGEVSYILDAIPSQRSEVCSVTVPDSVMNILGINLLLYVEYNYGNGKGDDKEKFNMFTWDQGGSKSFGYFHNEEKFNYFLNQIKKRR